MLFSRHVDVCCRRDTGAEYISANEKLFYINYHMTEWIERVIFSEKNILSRRLNFFLESVKVSKEQIIVQRVTNAKRNKILFLAILFCFTPYTFLWLVKPSIHVRRTWLFLWRFNEDCTNSWQRWQINKQFCSFAFYWRQSVVLPLLLNVSQLKDMRAVHATRRELTTLGSTSTYSPWRETLQIQGKMSTESEVV